MPEPPGMPTGEFKVGSIHAKKQTVYIVAGILVAVFGYGYYKNKKSQNAVVSASDNIDPATGYAYGSAQDQAALAGGGQLPIQGSGGNIIGYDSFGNPIYGSTGGPGSGGGFTNNAQWAQAAETAMGSNGNDSIAAALGKYLFGSPLTSEQVTIVQEAVAIEGQPPVAGASGHPPGYTTVSTQPNPRTHKVKVPNVIGASAEEARDRLQALDLHDAQTPATTPEGKTAIVTAQSPKGGSMVAPESSVSVHVRTR